MMMKLRGCGGNDYFQLSWPSIAFLRKRVFNGYRLSHASWPSLYLDGPCCQPIELNAMGNAYVYVVYSYRTIIQLVRGG